MAAPSASLERLPLELKQGIMKSLSDVRSLLSFIHTCKSLRNAFLGSPGIVSHAVTENEIGQQCLPLALARFKADEAVPTTLAAAMSNDSENVEKNLRDFCNNFVENQCRVMPIMPTWFSLQLALVLSKFHAAVERLTSLCIDEAEIILTAVERRRITKCLYIDEISKLLMRMSAALASYSDSVSHVFWRCFAPWEREQVIVAHGYLLRSACRFFKPGVGYGFLCGYVTELLLNHSLTIFDRLSGRPIGPFQQPRPRGCGPTDVEPDLWYSTLKKPDGTSRRFIDIPSIVAKYHDEDSGPADVWFITHMFRSNGYSGARADYTTWFNSIPEGWWNIYMFLSRDAWDDECPGSLPTSEEMAERSGANTPGEVI
ncbi:hypothetical protein JX265_001506 [Neoarthrinium moseri]|uniref:F-box domain-containing protein n=1 Tax=Neoarthrinium moseri TaxID=1658444 RepID=A0A9P9WVL7_9PEZI|nr:hypothetical protein JX266_012355 [Neoarthrinium moseri]KAI1879885.1 hypothetical protein JX265_001506 [Neoarthrinium moseri]